MLSLLRRLIARAEVTSPSLPGLPPDVTIYAVGDIHGCLKPLEQVYRKIDLDSATCSSRDVVEIYLGDYVDRGPDSSGVVESLIGRMRNRKVICIKGNHESLLEQFALGEVNLQDWLRYGGADTLRSYGATTQQISSNSEDLRAIIPQHHLKFIANLDGSVKIGPYFFTHAGVRPGRSLSAQSPTDLMWIRDDFLNFEGDFGSIVVHGHTPVPMVEFRPNRISLDTGAYMTGNLSCVRFDASGPTEI